MQKHSILNQKLLLCLLLMVVATSAGRIGGFMEPNCHKYRPDGTCECCSFRFWMTPDGCCKQVSDQCKDWCPMTGKCTCCYLGYVLENGCCVLPCEKPVPKCQEPSKKCTEPVKKWSNWPQKCVEPVKDCDKTSKKCEAPSTKWVESPKKCWVPEKPSVKICVEAQSCKSNKSCKSKECKSKKSKECKSNKSKECKSKKSKKCKSEKKSKIDKLEKKLLKQLKKAGLLENGSVMNRAWMGEGSKNNVWNKPAGLRTSYGH